MSAVNKYNCEQFSYGAVELFPESFGRCERLANFITIQSEYKTIGYLSPMCQITQPCEDMLVACQYGGIDMDCMNIFNAILIDGGLCCNFNGVHRKFMMNLTQVGSSMLS